MSGPDATFVAFGEAPRSRVDEFGFDRYLFFGQANVSGPGPQVYVNEIDPGVELAAHFHKVDQFQIFFGRAGSKFGRHVISPLMVHYTDAYSTYGPFGAGPEEPLMYATIRAESTNFGGVMPGARDELLYRGRRNLSADVRSFAVTDLPEPGRGSVDPVIESQQDGLATFLYRLGPGSRMTTGAPMSSAGRAYCVVAGEVVEEGRVLGRLSLGWSSRGAPELCLVGGERGASVLAMDFPYPPTPQVRLGSALGNEHGR